MLVFDPSLEGQPRAAGPIARIVLTQRLVFGKLSPMLVGVSLQAARAAGRTTKIRQRSPAALTPMRRAISSHFQ